MTDPYKILGINPNATDDQVKAAYREQAKKYHPDNYADNPLADLAGEKMQEINEAYDMIVAQRKARGGARSSGAGTGSAYTPGGGYSASSSSQFADIRKLINSGRLAEAQELLDGVPQTSRDAEWNFLKGSICYSNGWLDDALQYFQKAHGMNPQNQEYSAVYNQLVWQRQTGRSPQYGANSYNGGTPSTGNCSCCDICAAMYCANCFMDCCNGGCC